MGVRFARIVPALALLAAVTAGGAAAADAPAAGTPYLPLATGNRWMFVNGTVFVDAGSQPILCACPIAGRSAERIDASSANGTYLSSLFFARGPWSSGGLPGRTVTYLVGASADRGKTVVLAFQSADGSVPGYPAMDDRPVAGETLTLANHDGSVAEQTVVLTTGATLGTANGELRDIASARLSADGSALVLAFARGVGFASVSYRGEAASLAAYALAPVAPATQNPPARAVAGRALDAVARVVDAVIRQ